MTDNLALQIRALCDSTEPVTAAEAILRARRPEKRRHHLRPFSITTAVGAFVAVASCAAIAWNVSSKTPTGPATRLAHPRIVLTAARLHHILAKSSVAASSGTAQVTQATSENGAPLTNQSAAVTFDGANIDEQISVEPETPGSAAFTTDDRLVGGQFYIYTPGPTGAREWIHDTNSADDAASMQFPDPRTLYHALGPRGHFEILGTSTSGETTLTHLRALDPGALETAPLGNLADGLLTSFELWIDPNDVIRRMAFSSASTTVTVSFAHLGQPQSITAPHGAVDVAGKG